MTGIIFVTGGVISSIGKGVTASTISNLLHHLGYSTRIKKLDPYFNYNPGTMNPKEHGEVYVTDDGAETDMDMGHYERIGKVNSQSTDYITMGMVMESIISDEKNGKYRGATVQAIPHVTDRIKSKILEDVNEDFLICEIGGTVGDIETTAPLEVVSQLQKEYNNITVVHVPYLISLPNCRELKTKPIQHSVSRLKECGIEPDILACRSADYADQEIIEKLRKMCRVKNVIILANAKGKCLYNIPKQYYEAGLLDALTNCLNIKNTSTIKFPELNFVESERSIAIVTKYTNSDAHQSLQESIMHAGLKLGKLPKIHIIDSETKDFSGYDGIIIPGGFGARGIPGKIAAIKHARTNKTPILGICLGMQLMIIEALRSIGIDADSTEWNPETQNPAIHLIQEWREDAQIKIGTREITSGTMRLGAQKCVLRKTLSEIYQAQEIFRRHRHRYEVNPKFKEKLMEAELEIAATETNNNIIESIQRINHPWFIGVQYHPELSSRLDNPEPLILDFVKSVLK